MPKRLREPDASQKMWLWLREDNNISWGIQEWHSVAISRGSVESRKSYRVSFVNRLFVDAKEY